MMFKEAQITNYDPSPISEACVSFSMGRSIIVVEASKVACNTTLLRSCRRSLASRSIQNESQHRTPAARVKRQSGLFFSSNKLRRNRAEAVGMESSVVEDRLHGGNLRLRRVWMTMMDTRTSDGSEMEDKKGGLDLVVARHGEKVLQPPAEGHSIAVTQSGSPFFRKDCSTWPAFFRSSCQLSSIRTVLRLLKLLISKTFPMDPLKVRFTVTVEYVDSKLEKQKRDLKNRVALKSNKYRYEFDPNAGKEKVSSFWVDAYLPAESDYQEDFFEILLELQDAVGELPMTLSLTSDLHSDEFACADTDMVITEVLFGLLRTPFEFQALCVVDANDRDHAPVRVEKFEVGRRQIYLCNFFHDMGLFEIQMPMLDKMDRYRKEMRDAAQKDVNRLEQLKDFLAEQNDPLGRRHHFNEVLVKLPYENVKSFIYDIESVNKDMVKGTINIVYDHPPKVHMHPLVGNKGERANGRAERYVRWSQNFALTNFLDPMVHSSAIKCSAVVRKEAFYNLMIMLRTRLACPVSFRKVWPAERVIDLQLTNMEFPSQWPFEVKYLIECIRSRGVSGQKFILSSWKKFDEIVTKIDEYLYNGTRAGVENAVAYLTKIYFKVLKDDESSTEADYEKAARNRRGNRDENYLNVRKAIITPTRVLYYPPEPVMGCRMLRHYGQEKFLRIVFRDDTMDNLRNLSEAMINETIMKYMERSLTVGGETFYYLGYSNSQLRDQGCYFYRCSKVDDLMEVYKNMGEFKKDGVAKTMARFAQCFTQSYPSKLELPRDRTGEIPDYANSATNKNGEQYCFSDGVGTISMAKANELKTELDLPWTPSCIQFRYLGYKGVLSVASFLDHYANFIKTNNLPITKENEIWTKDVLFRPSQNKFTANEEHTKFEVVKYSTSGQVNLNKQVINIYDQVAGKQSHASHACVTRRILQLTDMHIEDIMRSLTEDLWFKLALRDLPMFVPYKQLGGFSNFVSEPFFRRMVLARAKSSLKFLSEKTRIAVPPDVGRNMFGIVDETGYLQYGQVFVQYSTNLHDKGKVRNATILTGDVMITKNPMMNGGDLRKFEAINIPALWHLCDVVVFSQHGPRPSPDEMAGSDLDGDEYSVIWDPELMLDYNEPATDYAAEKQPAVVVQLTELRAESVKFFKNYLLNDSIGVVANAHLANSDLFGLDSDVCQRIARKQIAAVDFAKSGIPMVPLENRWKGKNPPEKIERTPDFMPKPRLPFYQSNRLLGRVHRKIQRFVESVSAFIDMGDDTPAVDKYVHVDGWEEYESEAIARYARYQEEIQRILITFGVKNEAELFSQCFTDLKNRQLKNQEADSLSGFSTASLIQKQLEDIICDFRMEFFAGVGIDFGIYGKDKKALIQTKFTNFLNDGLRKLAVAYYKVAYRNGEILSFPWVIWDVIDKVRLENQVPYNPDPLGNEISNEIERKVFDQYDAFVERIRNKLPGVVPYIDGYNGLGTLLYFLCKWKEEHNVLAEVSKTEVIVMFMKYATGQLFKVPGFLELVEGRQVTINAKNDLKAQPGGLGRILLTFFVEISHDGFLHHAENWLTVPTFGGNELGEDFCDIRKWQAVQLAARDTYFTTVFQSSPSVLSSDATKGCVKRQSTVIFGEPFTIEVVKEYEKHVNLTLMRSLCDMSGCTHIAYRFPEMNRYNKNPDFRIRVTLMPKGTPEAILRLRSLLTIEAPITRDDEAADVVYLMKHNMTRKLIRLCNNVNAQNAD
uniref:RNA-directed RNA polymerase n=1 Tax=Panagrellus redivivus TaxID=6233 RepID=A0A7E4WA67_PANRE